MIYLELTPGERDDIQQLLRVIAAQYGSAEAGEFLNVATVLAHQLPCRLRLFLNEMKLAEVDASCIISGYEIDIEKIGHTPLHWRAAGPSGPTVEEEMLLVLCGSLLGDVFGWATQQAGRIVHNVLPIPGHEKEQLGTGSEELLTWHTEDAFHHARGDYLGLMCLRNPDNVPTTIATVTVDGLPERYVQLLREPRFTIRPDESHLAKNRIAGAAEPDAGSDWALDASYRRIDEMNRVPRREPILTGRPPRYYARVDPYFMDPDMLDVETQEAFEAFVKHVDSNVKDVCLRPGDVLFIDNFRAVHGRRPFKARYDGTDRWLKRINITRDLRKSRSLRRDCLSRVIYS